MKEHLLAYYPSHLKSYGVGHAAFSIMREMESSKLECSLYLPAKDSEIKSNILKVTILPFILRGVYKMISPSTIRKISELIFFSQITKNDIIYLWPGFSIDLLRKIKKKSNTVIIENINFHQEISRPILDIDMPSVEFPHGNATKNS